MWLFGSLWDRWQIAFKVATPLLHIAFSAAQIHGSMVFWRMYKRQQRLIKEQEDGADSLKEENIGITLHSSAESMGPIVPPHAVLPGSRPETPR
jgi:hypothetical protein